MNREDEIGRDIVDAAYKVHKTLGPGLLESVYEAAMAYELTKRGYRVERQKAFEASYEEVALGIAFRADLLVESLVLIELKSVEEMRKLFSKITLNYLKLGKWRLGYLINFNVPLIKDGIKRIANDLPE